MRLASFRIKSSPTGFPRSLGAPGCEPSGAKRVSCSQALGQAAPVQRTLEKQGSVGPLLSGQACLWPCCYGGRLPQVSLRPQAFEGCSPERVRTQGQLHCPFCQTCPKPPQLWQLAPSGTRVFPCSVALICPQHPSAQVLPPAAELSPPAVQKILQLPPRQEVPT